MSEALSFSSSGVGVVTLYPVSLPEGAVYPSCKGTLITVVVGMSVSVLSGTIVVWVGSEVTIGGECPKTIE